MRAVARYVPAAWALVLAVLVLGPALGAGYLLTYDMVWVPDLALRPDFLGAGTALPRAVPSDAVVAVLDEVVPGMLLQKVVLLGALVLGGLGAATLGDRSLPARLAATSVYVWSPFVVERLWIGHWPLLLCWAVLPWLVREGARLRTDPRVGAVLPLLLVAGSFVLSPEVAGTAAVPIDSAVENTRALGQVIYTRYVFLFQAAGGVLLVAMIGAIVLTLQHKPGVRRQDVFKQTGRKRHEGVELVKVKPGQGL